MTTTVPSEPLTEVSPKNQCAACKKAFKVADRLFIESNTEDRYHAGNCWNNGKDRFRPIFFGLYQEKDAKLSSVDKARIQSRLKKMRRQVKSRPKNAFVGRAK